MCWRGGLQSCTVQTGSKISACGNLDSVWSPGAEDNCSFAGPGSAAGLHSRGGRAAQHRTGLLGHHQAAGENGDQATAVACVSSEWSVHQCQDLQPKAFRDACAPQIAQSHPLCLVMAEAQELTCCQSAWLRCPYFGPKYVHPTCNPSPHARTVCSQRVLCFSTGV